jgi:hypothetical protein
MEQTEFYETSAYKIQTPGNYPEESIQHSEHDESSKSRISYFYWHLVYFYIIHDFSKNIVRKVRWSGNTWVRQMTETNVLESNARERTIGRNVCIYLFWNPVEQLRTAGWT